MSTREYARALSALDERARTSLVDALLDGRGRLDGAIAAAARDHDGPSRDDVVIALFLLLESFIPVAVAATAAYQVGAVAVAADELSERAGRPVTVDLGEVLPAPPGSRRDGTAVADALRRRFAEGTLGIRERLRESAPDDGDAGDADEADRHNDLSGVVDAALWHALSVARLTARTEGREAAHAVMREGPRLAPEAGRRLQWITQLDDRVCAACLALHGRIWPADRVPPHSHPGCRCLLIPVGDDEAETVDPVAWLEGRPESDLPVHLGSRAAASAYLAGEVALGDFLGLDRDQTWGPQIYRRSLKEIRARRR